MRFLGIDYGTKRIGLAAGDSIAIATPLPAVLTADPRRQDDAIGAVIRERGITEIVLGLPLNMDGSHGPAAAAVEAFAERIGRKFGLPVVFIDERLTSSVAEQGLTQRELRALRSKGVVDSRAAALILQDYLDQRFPPTLPELPE